MKRWMAAATLAALGACIENPDTDQRLRDSLSARPGNQYTGSSNTVWVDFDAGTLGASVYRSEEQGNWIFVAENYSLTDLPEVELLLQVNYPTSLSCCGTGSPDFFPTPLYEAIVLVPSLLPRQMVNLARFNMPQIQDPGMAYIKAIRLRGGGIHTRGPFPIAGLYEGGYTIIRNGAAFQAGRMNAVIDGSGRMGIRAMSDRPGAGSITLVGAFNLDTMGSPTYLHTEYFLDSIVSRELPASAFRTLPNGFEIRYMAEPADTVVLTADRASLGVISAPAQP